MSEKEFGASYLTTERTEKKYLKKRFVDHSNRTLRREARRNKEIFHFVVEE